MTSLNPLNKDTSIYLHHNYIASVLNDVFGIQVRGGCVCAGPYAQSLLGMDEKLTDRFEQILVEDQRLDRVHLRRQHESSQYEILRPGFVRFRPGFSLYQSKLLDTFEQAKESCPFFFTDEQVDQVCKAVEWSAEHAWKLLPSYVFDCETGEWKNKQNLTYHDRRWLGDIRFTKSGVDIKENNIEAKHGTTCVSLAEAITEAEKLSKSMKLRSDGADQTSGFLG